MSTLRNVLKHGDFIMEKRINSEGAPDLLEVVMCDTHNVIVYRTNPKEEVVKIPKRLVNLAYIKVNPEAIKILYQNKIKELEEETSNDT